VGHDRRAHVPVDGDLGQRGGAQRRSDERRVAAGGQLQQFLVTVGQVIVLVGGDHPHGPGDVRPVGGVFAQCLHLLTGALLGGPAVRQVGYDVAFGQFLAAA